MKINSNICKQAQFSQYGLMDYLTEAHVDCSECNLDEEIKTLEQIIYDVDDDIYRVGGDIGEFKELAFSVKPRTEIHDWIGTMRVVFNIMPALCRLTPETTPLQESYLRMVTNIMRKWKSGDIDASRSTLSEAVAMSLWATNAKVCNDLCSVIDHARTEHRDGADGLIGKSNGIAATMVLCAQMYYCFSDETFIRQEFKFSALSEIINLAEGTVVKHWSNLFDAINLKDTGI